MIGSACETATTAGAGMALDDPGQRRDDARLHLDERLAAREAKPARMALHGLPLGLAGELPELLTCPLADVAVGQVTLDAHREAVRARDRQRGLARALELRGVHGRELGQLVDPRGATTFACR